MVDAARMVTKEEPS